MQHRIKQPYSISVKNLLTFQTFIWIFPCKHLCIDTLKREVLSIMIVVTELKKNSQKVVMFNLFHVQVYSGKKLCEYILVKVDKISVLFLRSGKGKVLGHLLLVCSSKSEKKTMVCRFKFSLLSYRLQ